jgi:phosphoglycerol transferase MdoB-like AlkP superfamily enzyme
MAATMEDNTRIIDELLGKAAEYGRAELELAKLKALDKASDIVSASVPRLIVMLSLTVFILFLNLGIALWVGGLLGNLFLGFFAVAVFYGIIALILHLFMRKCLKKKVGDYIIKRVLN